MAKMLGRQTSYGLPCSCCCGDRTKRAEKRREDRFWRAETAVRAPSPALLDDPSDCAHGCNGDCLTIGSETCTFTCHADVSAML